MTENDWLVPLLGWLSGAGVISLTVKAIVEHFSGKRPRERAEARQQWSDLDDCRKQLREEHAARLRLEEETSAERVRCYAYMARIERLLEDHGIALPEYPKTGEIGQVEP